MGWDISEKGFRIVLSPEVPETVTKNLGKDVDAFLAEQNLSRDDIKSWVMHTGGPEGARGHCGIPRPDRTKTSPLPGNRSEKWGIFLPHPFCWFWKMSTRTAGPLPERTAFWLRWALGFAPSSFFCSGDVSA